jgi:hypothetical protein
MHEVVPQQIWSRTCDEGDQSVKMEQALEGLQIENRRLKQLVVRLSETIIKSVVTRR